MAYENTSGMPFSGNLTFQGGGLVNGEPVNRSNAGYKTVGGFILSSDSNNSGLVANFGVVVSTLPSGDNTSFAIGCPAGYVPRGIVMANNSVMQNEPAKPGYMLQDIPVTVGYEGTYRYLSWTNTQTGTTATPFVGCTPIFRAVSGGTAGCDIGAIEFLQPGYNTPIGFAELPGYVTEYTSQNGVVVEFNFDTTGDNANLAGIPFKRTVTLTSAAAATAVTIIPDSLVYGGKKVYIEKAYANVNGSTAWGTTATVAIQDTAGSPVAGITYAVAGLTANATLQESAAANVTLGTAVSQGAGFTASKGIVVKGNANGTGSDLIVTVYGFIA